MLPCWYRLVMWNVQKIEERIKVKGMRDETKGKDEKLLITLNILNWQRFSIRVKVLYSFVSAKKLAQEFSRWGRAKSRSRKNWSHTRNDCCAGSTLRERRRRCNPNRLLCSLLAYTAAVHGVQTYLMSARLLDIAQIDAAFGVVSHQRRRIIIFHGRDCWHVRIAMSKSRTLSERSRSHFERRLSDASAWSWNTKDDISIINLMSSWRRPV